MQKWTYAGFNVGTNGLITSGHFVGAAFGPAANSMGAEGWELVLSFSLPNGSEEFIFKHPA
jgi:hypothetical protein